MSYARKLEALLRSHANPEAAAAMAAYMRDLFPFLGIKTPERAALTRQFIAEHGVPDGEELEEAVRELWALPEREYQYAALHLFEKRAKKSPQGRIALLEEIITSKSWWDTVDAIAGKLVGAFMREYPALIPETINRWIESEDMWLRRSAILFQLNYREATDEKLLFDLIRRCAEEKEFFIRKAIGWALRQYAKTDAGAVRRFVSETPLSPLSVREALKEAGAQEAE
jgi:3-methyladenine DNA glycosylase AlkD